MKKNIKKTLKITYLILVTDIFPNLIFEDF